MEVDINLLVENNLTPDEFVFLYYLAKGQIYSVNLVTDYDKMEASGFIKKGGIACKNSAYKIIIDKMNKYNKNNVHYVVVTGILVKDGKYLIARRADWEYKPAYSGS